MKDQKKINRNNRSRGGKFEKIGADYLDMDVVPYSGSNSRFGYGDVRDSIWLGEFKNITPKDNKVTIKQSWIIKNLERATEINKLSFLAWMPCGKMSKFIILDNETWDKTGFDFNMEYDHPVKSINAVNLIIDITSNMVKSLKPTENIVRIQFKNDYYYMMRMELFKHLIIKNNLKGTRSTI